MLRLAMIAACVVALAYLWGYNSGRAEVIELFDRRIDDICMALPWPRPAFCAKGVPSDATP